MNIWRHDGLTFRFVDLGTGLPFLFLHGLGSDLSQPLGLFSAPPGIRLLSLDCRGHGKTRPLGDPERIGLSEFADDVLGFLDHLEVERPIVGGISMGAGVALNFALRYPSRVSGAVLSRPAWLDQPFPSHLHIYPLIAGLIERHGTSEGRRQFMDSPELGEMARAFPTSAASLLGQFDDPRAHDAVVRLERIPRDVPSAERSAWATISVPTLVLANREDPIHPFEYGRVLSELIPASEFRELTPKAISERQHRVDVQSFIEDFFQRHFEFQELAAC